MSKLRFKIWLMRWRAIKVILQTIVVGVELSYDLTGKTHATIRLIDCPPDVMSRLM